MDHNEIELDVKQTNRRHSTGRYGVKTNKTVKKHPFFVKHAKKAPETICSLDVDNSAPLTRRNYYHGAFIPAPVSVGISLNKRKNWESVKNLKKSQDDINFGYRVVEIDNYSFKGDNERAVGDLKVKLYRLDKAPAKYEKRTRIESGNNRKGYFVREKRKRGKKGVNSYNNAPIHNSTNARNNNSSDSSSTSESENDSQDEGATDNEHTNDKYTVYIVQKRTKDATTMIRSGPFYGCDCTRSCHCNKELGTRRRRDVAQQVASFDINVQ